MKELLLAVAGLALAACASTPAIPDVAGMPQDEAEDEITAAGYEIDRVIRLHDEEVETGHVVRTRPSAGSELDPDQGHVILVVSEYAPLHEVHDACHSSVLSLRDDDRTLIVQGRGEDDGSAAMAESFATMSCVLTNLDTPSSIVTRMDTTRALDGVQTGEHDELHYTWSYHPRSGMNIIVEDRS